MMDAKTKRKLESIPVMAFYHADGLVSAWQQAKRFTGKKGRIGTLPDVVDAKLNTGIDSFPWNTYFTTASAEYMGVTRGGNKILIVAHGIGPMSTLDGILKAYSHQFKDKTRNRRGGRISQKEFLDLESGKYGDVRVVELDTILKSYKYPFIQILTYNEAYLDPLLDVRLGPKAAEYIHKHVNLAREWHLEQAGFEPENHYKFHKERWKSYLARRKDLHLGFAMEISNPFIIHMGDDLNCSYEYYPLEKGKAFAHLLSAGGLMNMHHEGYESLVCDFNCHGWSDGVRLIGVRENAVVNDIHPGVEGVRRLLHKNWQSLMKPVTFSGNVGFRALMKVGNRWFTQILKMGDGMDTYEAEFLITSTKRIGRPVDIITTIGGYHGFLKYGIKEVQAKAPIGANSYFIAGELDKSNIIWEGGNPEYHRFPVQFCKVKVDNTKRLMHEDELKNNFDKLMELVAKE